MKKWFGICVSCLCMILSGCRSDNVPLENKVTAIPNTESKIISSGQEKTIEAEWDNYRNKVWIDADWSEGKEYDGYSFIITKREGNAIEGYFAIDSIIDPDIDIYSENKKAKYGTFSGMIEENEAACDFLRKDGKTDEAVKIQLTDELKIQVVVDSKQDSAQSEINYYKPYSLHDQENDDRVVFRDSEEKVMLEKWGSVKLVSRLRCDEKRNVLFVYLTDNDGNILYDFGAPKYFPYDTHVRESLFYDINQDGLKDLILIVTGEVDTADERLARVYFQNDSLGFEENDDLFQILNDEKAPHNQDVKTVMDYLDSQKEGVE